MAARTSQIAMALLALAVLIALPSSAAKPAPSFTVFPIDGGALSPASLRGKVVVLEFSGTWCIPCRFIEAAFKEMYADYPPTDVVFLGVFISPNNDNEIGRASCRERV